MDFTVRPLSPEDWRDWNAIRLEGLRLYPEAFGSSYEEEAQNDEDKIRQFLTNNKLFGAYVDQALVGVCGFYAERKNKMRHRGTLFGMYLKETFRGKGIANALVHAVISHAATQVVQLHCSVITDNAAALKLYLKHGFEVYGTEPRALYVGDRYIDEYLLALKLD